MYQAWTLADLNSITKNNIKVFSTFSCGGGSSFGYKLNGCDVIANCEIDPRINDIYKRNHNVRYSYECSIRDLLNQTLPDELHNIDILDGSPPCTSFSFSGNRHKDWGKEKKFAEGNTKQVLDTLFFDFIELANKLRPKVVIAENVKGLTQGKAKVYFNEILKRFGEIGYNTQNFIVNAGDCGVPQRRERLFIVAVRNDLPVIPLNMNFNEPHIHYRHIKDAHEQEIANKESYKTYHYWQQCKAGKNFATVANGSYFNHYKLGDDCLVPTLTTSCHSNLYSETTYRRISDREIILSSSFPIDYDFGGKRPAYICGMSVPPLMMQRVTKEVIDTFFK